MDIDNFIDRFSGFTEEYKFYNGEVILRYQPDEHVYYLFKDGELIKQAGVTSVTHIVDKSEALIPWSAKMVVEKLLRTVPTLTLPTGEVLVHLPEDEFKRLVLEAKSAPRDKVEEAADVGKAAHDWIERYIKSVLAGNEDWKLELLAHFPDDERSKNCCVAALDWMQQHNVRWLCTEKKIYSRKYQYAGTMDGKAIVDSCQNPMCCPNPFKDRLSVIDWKSSNYLYIEYLAQTAAYEYAEEEETGDDIRDRWVIRLGKDDGAFDPWHVEHDTFEADFSAFLNMLFTYHSVADLKDRMKVKKDWIKSEKKKQKDLDKQRQLAIKCRNADKYKGVRPPTCNGGEGCQACREKYEQRQKEKENIKV